ncbi:SRPBCC family protein [Streptomyces sp. NBC_01317]|uniref:SRPBCC family protein n=1 Tax=Streptomyces sp. NBC_01317 TaxID=2903822 RepID=UPI002E15C08F|nr:SRPBCC family protein [Streptomyces sp. NBC_01317]
MTSQHATRFLDASPAQVRHALLDPLALRDWNPAFKRVDGPARATTGVPYALTVVGGLTGTWQYTRIEEREIDCAWQVPGFQETGTWRLRPHLDGTLVTHAFTHQGPLARALAKAYRGVAELRLDRLTERAAHVGLLADAAV